MAGSTDPLNLQALIDAGQDEETGLQKNASAKKKRSKKNKKSNNELTDQSSSSSGSKPKKEKRRKSRLMSSSGSEGNKEVLPKKIIVNKSKTLQISIQPEKVVVARKSDDVLIQMAKRYHQIPTKRSQKANWARFGLHVASKPVVADSSDVWDVNRVRGMGRPKYVKQVENWNQETTVLFNQRIELEKVVQARTVNLRFDSLLELRNDLPELFDFFQKVYEPEGW